MLHFSPSCHFLVGFIFGNETLEMNKNKEKDPAATLMKFYLQFMWHLETIYIITML